MASGKSKKVRDDNCFAQALRAMLREKVGEEGLAALREQARGCLSADMTNDEAIAMALIRKAIEGDAAAAKYICDAARRCGDAAEADRPFRLTLRVVRDGD
ncbi:MAG: hypothetical protein VB021_05880 [Oscillospiraceae bacterium]|nr:hypothetical protein [Oscillospiraceae bacterium]